MQEINRLKNNFKTEFGTFLIIKIILKTHFYNKKGEVFRLIAGILQWTVEN